MRRAAMLTLLLTACGSDDQEAAKPFDPVYKPDPVDAPARVKPTPTPTPTATPTPTPTPPPTAAPAPAVTRLVVRWKEGETPIGRDAEGNLLPRTTAGLVQKERVFEIPGLRPAGLVMQHDSFPDTRFQLGETLCTPTFTGTGFLQDHFTCDLDQLKRNCTVDVPAGVYRYIAPTEVTSVDPVYTLRLADAPGSWCAALD